MVRFRAPLLQRLEGTAEDRQHAVLLDLVRSHIATVLGSAGESHRRIGHSGLGFDSLTAVEMRGKSRHRPGAHTLIFDYFNSAALAG